MKKNIIKPLLISISVVLILLIALVFVFLNYKKSGENSDITPVQEETQTDELKSDVLDKINAYQKRYFEIAKRHDALLDLANSEESKKDLSELKALFEEVKKEIPKDLEYIKKYDKIKKDYKNNTGNTTLEMNEFVSNEYKAFDALLNETYKAVQQNISPDEFEKLKESQRQWLKDVEDYNKVFEAKEFGTIATLVKLSYEINMRAYRTLLLMLYFNEKQTPVVLEDFLGNWDEIIAGRIYIEIKKNKNNIQVEYGGSNSAYSHSKSVFECEFDNKMSDLVCNGAKNTDYFISCNGYNPMDSMDKFTECMDKTPNKQKDDKKEYSDDKTRVLTIKKVKYGKHVIDDEQYLDNERKNQLKKDYENIGLYFQDDRETVYYKSKK